MTTTPPLVAAFGTFAMMVVGFQVVTDEAVTPANFTVLEPWLKPKLVPVIVTCVVTGPLGGLRLEMFGAEITLNGIPLLVIPLAVTTIFPEVAPNGTGTRIPDGLQTPGPAATPLNVTLLAP